MWTDVPKFWLLQREFFEVTCRKPFHESRWWNNEYTIWQISLLDTDSWNYLDYIISSWLYEMIFWGLFLVHEYKWKKKSKETKERIEWLQFVLSWIHLLNWLLFSITMTLFSLPHFLLRVYSHVHIKWWHEIPRTFQQWNQFAPFITVNDRHRWVWIMVYHYFCYFIM